MLTFAVRLLRNIEKRRNDSMDVQYVNDVLNVARAVQNYMLHKFHIVLI